MKCYLIGVLTCVSLMTSDAEHLLCQMASLSSLEKCLYKSFAHFELGCLFVIEFKCSLYILEPRLLSDI